MAYIESALAGSVVLGWRLSSRHHRHRSGAPGLISATMPAATAALIRIDIDAIGMDTNGFVAGERDMVQAWLRPSTLGAYPNRFSTMSEAGRRVQTDHSRTPVRRAIIPFIAQL